MTTILLLGAGKRVEMVKRLKELGTVYSYEIDSNAPISFEVGTFLGKSWKPMNECAEHIQEIIETHDIDLVIPFQDEAVYVAQFLKNVTVIGASLNPARVCFDKTFFEKFMQDRFPWLYPYKDIINPANNIAKPRFGFGSKGIHFITDIEHYSLFDNAYDYVIQRRIDGTEYSVDCYFNKNGEFVDAVCRSRDKVVAGEVVQSTVCLGTLANNLISYAKMVGQEIGLVGPCNFQFIVADDVTFEAKLIEINARFCGGYTLSMEAGLDTLEFIRREYIEGEVQRPVHKDKEMLRLVRSHKDHFIDFR